MIPAYEPFLQKSQSRRWKKTQELASTINKFGQFTIYLPLNDADSISLKYTYIRNFEDIEKRMYKVF